MAARAEPAAATPAAEPAARQRVAKAMARAGLCSRRDAEQWVRDGRVSVNGELLENPARDVGPDDEIVVDGAPLPAAQKTRLFLFHKPRGLVTSDHDPEGRPTVTDYLREHWPDGPRVVTVGRLDINTEGLLLLTNDGGLARVLELPETGWLRRYRVRARGEATPDRLDALSAGITVDGMEYAGIEARIDRQQGRNCWMTMGLREGKNREIKRVLEHLELEVNRLIRVSFGPFQLADLPDGAVEEVRTRVLRDQLGETLAAQAGVDFEGAAEVEEGAPLRVVGRAKTTIALRERAEDGGATAAASERPARSPRGAGPRRHVSALRTNKDDGEAPRTRIERSSTTDRRDRTVAVEHRMRAVPETTRRSAGGRSASHLSPSAQAKRVRVARSGGGRDEDRRESAARGDAPRGGDRPMRRMPARTFGAPSGDAGGPGGGRAGSDASRRGGSASAGRAGDGERRVASRGQAGRDSESGGRRYAERLPRADGEPAPTRRSAPVRARSGGERAGGDRPARGQAAGERAADRPYRERAGRGGEGAARAGGKTGFGRREGGGGGVGEGGEARGFAKRAAPGRTARPDGQRADRQRAGDARPGGGRPGARPAGRGGDRPGGGRPGGRPAGGRPSGGKPSGNKPRGGGSGAPRGKR